MMQKRPIKKEFALRNLVAPLVMIAFAVAYYQFSAVYIQDANLQLVQNGNLAVYVPVQQLKAYMAATLDFTYVTVLLGVIFFLYHMAKLVQFRRVNRD